MRSSLWGDGLEEEERTKILEAREVGETRCRLVGRIQDTAEQHSSEKVDTK